MGLVVGYKIPPLWWGFTFCKKYPTDWEGKKSSWKLIGGIWVGVFLRFGGITWSIHRFLIKNCDLILVLSCLNFQTTKIKTKSPLTSLFDNNPTKLCHSWKFDFTKTRWDFRNILWSWWDFRSQILAGGESGGGVFRKLRWAGAPTFPTPPGGVTLRPAMLRVRFWRSN